MSVNRELILERVGNVTRLGVIEEGNLCGYYVSQGDRGSLSGNIYVGRVQNTLPGMNAAFVDIGLRKNAYLPSENGKPLDVKAGELILCRVSKEPGGTKGPRISRDITLPGKLCAITPGLKYAGVSKKVEDPETRDRLYAAAQRLCSETGIGLIVRTSCENETEEALREDYERVVQTWQSIEREAKYCPEPRLIWSDGDLTLFAVREFLDENTVRVRVDGKELAEELMEKVRSAAPKFADRVEIWTGDIPLFDLLRVDHQLESAMNRQVRLKSGATIVIDETEAMTVIDVNTGSYTGRREQEATILKTDLEAAEEIARQMRLRELGGIIIIDFIDLGEAANRELLLNRLKEAVRNDKSRVTVVDMTALGLVEVTRKKVRMPLSKRMLKMCRACHGEGRELRTSERALACAREIIRRRRLGDTTVYRLTAAEELIASVTEIFSGTPEGIVFESASVSGWTFIPCDPITDEIV